MRENRMMPIGQNTFYITVLPKPGGEFSGEVTSAALSRSAEFTSISRLIILLEEWLDAAAELCPSGRPIVPVPADYEIEIIFRQNYSWQGKLRCIRDNTEAVFRSVLELLIRLETSFAN